MVKPLALLSAPLLLALTVGCQGGSNPHEMADSGKIYTPGTDSRVRPANRWAKEIVDERTGFSLIRENYKVTIPGYGENLRLWRLDRRISRQPPIFFLTKSTTKADEGWWFLKPTYTEIVHANEDGFFPFRDALKESDFSFRRVTAMLDRFDRQDEPRGNSYWDNRDAYIEANRQAQDAVDARKVRQANFEKFDFNPIKDPRSEVFFPTNSSALFDPLSQKFVAADGSTLSAKEQAWRTFRNRDGRFEVLRAVWSDAAERSKWSVEMIPFRAYREGYGESRGVVITRVARLNDPAGGGARPIEAPMPDKKILADLINMSPISGRHRGHIVVVASSSE